MKVTWKGGMAFEAVGDSGQAFRMDAYPESGGEGSAPTPVEALLASIAACSGMDVISILKKKQQTVSAYSVEVTGVRAEPGQYPRPFKSITIRHILSGPDLDEQAVARSVQLSDEKYCTVISTLRLGPQVDSVYEITPQS